MTKKRKWTAEETDTLRTMYHAGIRHKEIARILNRSVGAVQQQAHAMNKRDAAEGYVHVKEDAPVSDTLTTEQAPTTWIGRVKRLLGIG